MNYVWEVTPAVKALTLFNIGGVVVALSVLSQNILAIQLALSVMFTLIVVVPCLTWYWIRMERKIEYLKKIGKV